MSTIALIPIGIIRGAILNILKLRLEESFDRGVIICQPLEHPSYAYDKSRRQYHSTAILHKISGFGTGVYERALGVVKVDLFVPDLNFVFGEADLVNRVAVISLIRLDQRFYNLPEDEGLFVRRAVKEAVHELGHTYGLRHCKRPDCVMFFSNSIMDTDNKGENFCPTCAKLLKLKSVVM